MFTRSLRSIKKQTRETRFVIAAFTIPCLTGRRRQDSGLPLQQYGLNYEFLPV